MNLYAIESWVLLRALLIFAFAVASLTFVGIIAGIKAWLESRRNVSRAAPAATRAPRDMASAVQSANESYATGSSLSAHS